MFKEEAKVLKSGAEDELQRNREGGGWGLGVQSV